MRDSRTERRCLTAADLLPDPIEQFDAWFRDARERSGLGMPEAVCLSSIDDDGFPDGRMVLLKGHDARGFVFYTNLESTKGRSLQARPRAALTFYWEALGRQVRIKGRVERVGEDEADRYFESRPRDSQLGAWASAQSQVLESREALERRFAEESARFGEGAVLRPPHWTGLRVIPHRIEFWQEGPHRLHDRFAYARGDGGWRVERLCP